MLQNSALTPCWAYRDDDRADMQAVYAELQQFLLPRFASIAAACLPATTEVRLQQPFSCMQAGLPILASFASNKQPQHRRMIPDIINPWPSVPLAARATGRA